MAPVVAVPSRTSRSSGSQLLPHWDGLATGTAIPSREVLCVRGEGQHVAEDKLRQHAAGHGQEEQTPARDPRRAGLRRAELRQHAAGRAARRRRRKGCKTAPRPNCGMAPSYPRLGPSRDAPRAHAVPRRPIQERPREVAGAGTAHARHEGGEGQHVADDTKAILAGKQREVGRIWC